MTNPYDTLGVKPEATTDDIKKAFRKKAKKSHPDKGGNPQEFREASNAYALLVNPARRKHFDDTGKTDDPDDTQRKIVGDLSALFVQAVDSLNPKYDDIVSAVRSCIEDSRKKFVEFKRNSERRKDKFADAIKRAKRKKTDGENIVVMALELQVQQCQTAIMDADNRIADADTMVAMLECYEWIVEQQEFGGIYSTYFGRKSVTGFPKMS
jgi:curved DNA-binding protein CbpA